MEDLFEELGVPLAGQFLLELIDPTRRSRVDRRIDVAEVPLVGRELAVGVHVPFAAEQDELTLGPFQVQPGQGDAVERRVPGREPGVFPLVGNRQHVEPRELSPVAVPDLGVLGGRWRPRWIALEPQLDAVVVELFGPEQPGQRLALDSFLVLAHATLVQRVVECVGFATAQVERRVMIVECAVEWPVREAGANDHGLAGPDRGLVIGRGLGAETLRVGAIPAAMDDGVVKSILHVVSAVGDAE